MTQPLYSIGHSNQPLDRFLELLSRHGIEALVDIRRFPGSRKFPHFNQEHLRTSLQKVGIEYHWIVALGGRRTSKNADTTSPNLGLRNKGFRNYADYMLTDEFRQGVERLLEIAGNRPHGDDVCRSGLLALPSTTGQRFSLSEKRYRPAHFFRWGSATSHLNRGRKD